MFSDSILIGEVNEVFLPCNVVLLGPVGAGKSMVLNLTRIQVLSQWKPEERVWPRTLREVSPFFGISVNLTRSSFQIFGRRSVARSMGIEEKDNYSYEIAAASDFLTHYLLGEFIKGIRTLLRPEAAHMLEWMGIDGTDSLAEDRAREIGKWDCWNGSYEECQDWDKLEKKCNKRVSDWIGFLSMNLERVPEEIWRTKASPERALHNMGNLVRSLGRLNDGKRLSLFVFLDQYEELVYLNKTHGTELQRMLNGLIKARDPVVFYKIGARTHDWGRELRVSGSEAMLEQRRDYVIVDLSSVLMRTENGMRFFPRFAKDVARRRLDQLGIKANSGNALGNMLGQYSPSKEVSHYSVKGDRENWRSTIKGLPAGLSDKLWSLVNELTSPLEMRLASAWALQAVQRGKSEEDILAELDSLPWSKKKWWRKERVEVGLIQVSSHLNQNRCYFGLATINYLSGGNITAFLMICGHIWDVATRRGHDPFQKVVPPQAQTEGVMKASKEWAETIRTQPAGGAKRYQFVLMLGHLISGALRADEALSNPGHSGFSLYAAQLSRDDGPTKEVRRFLEDAVGFAALEERSHRSKNEAGARRLKYYLHPLLSPLLTLPFKRVKEPWYTTVETVYEWLTALSDSKGRRTGRFGSSAKVKEKVAAPGDLGNLWNFAENDKGTEDQ